MFNIFKKLKEQQEEIERLRIELSAINKVCDMYCAWRGAYMWSISEMIRTGKLTRDESDQIYKEAQRYIDIWNDRNTHKQD